MGIETVAECVETPAALTRLKTIAINYVQGFYLHTPEPIENSLNQQNVVDFRNPRSQK